MVALLAPAQGVPPVLDTVGALTGNTATLAAGTGPVALDAERASGFRYSARAYLVQLRRAGVGTMLIDPIPTRAGMPALAAALRGPEWVLHAASQDLPCLAELGLTPAAVFDTELAGRLLGFERVGLGAIVERTLGLRLEKGFGAADWSVRPLPPEWLVYAALDVEVLLELREVLRAALAEQGKTEWARQEFEHVRLAGPPAAKVDRWRRTSGIHGLRRTRQLAAVRELWSTRDEVAQERDVAPGRVLPDTAMVAAVLADPASREELVALPVFRGRAQRRQAGTWFAALERARALSPEELPRSSAPHDGPPPVNRWAERDAQAHERLLAARAVVATVHAATGVPVENLLLPDLLRRVCWAPPNPVGAAGLDADLAAAGARPWQRELLVDRLVTAWSSQGE